MLIILLFVVVFDIHVIVLVSLLNRMFALNGDLCYVQNTPRVVLWQKESYYSTFRVQVTSKQDRLFIVLF